MNIKNKNKFEEAITLYCRDLPTRWPNEKRKWVYPKQFHEKFDLKSDDLSQNLDESINNSAMQYRTAPRGMLIKMASLNQEGLRKCLRELFYSTDSLDKRIRKFKDDCKELNELIAKETGRKFPSSGQTYSSTYTLLSLFNASHYYNYRFGICRDMISYFGIDASLKKSDANKFDKYAQIMDTINESLSKSDAFKKAVSKCYNDDDECYKDHNLRIATTDFCYYVYSSIINKDENVDDADDDADDSEKDGDTDLIKLEKNVIFCGVPGCGKSHTVNKKLMKAIVYRVTFYDELSYSDFVGQIAPVLEGEKVVYKIKQGIFLDAFIKAYTEPKKQVCLVIEEINRGNASAIFGDIFQLLDRDSSGKSIYAIKNQIIMEFLHSHKDYSGVIESMEKLYGKENVGLPTNLHIVATMNLDDQNVYTLDNAFKRRFKMVYVSNKFNDDSEYDKRQKTILLDFMGLKDLTWNKFLNVINGKIASSKQAFNIDKQLGKYFIKHEVLEKLNIEDKPTYFIDNVLVYLFNDIAKFDKASWFRPEINTIEDIHKAKGNLAAILSKDLFDELGLTKQNE